MSVPKQEIITFIAEFTGYSRHRINQETTLFGDLGVDGADGWELIEAFGNRFGADIKGFRPDKHFGPEGMPLSAPFRLLWSLLGWLVKKRDERTPEEIAGFKPIRIADLITAAESKRWTL